MNKRKNLFSIFVPMKYLSVLFSFYVFLLSCAPCVDEQGLFSADEHLCSETSQNNSPAHQDEQDCSPFCTCACCGSQGFNVPSAFSFHSSNGFVAQKNSAVYTFHFSSDFISSIWQPPKIS